MLKLTGRPAVVAAVCAVIATASSSGYAADTTYQFFGDCADCVLTKGPLGQIADLVLRNYTEGAPIELADFVSLEYFGSNLVAPYVVKNDDWLLVAYDVSGAIGPKLPKPEDFRVMFGDGLSFVTEKSGNWYTCDYDTNYSGVCNYQNNADTGTGQWGAPVPEPSTYAMFAVGLAMLGAARVRRARG
jgi:hypothetical protein